MRGIPGRKNSLKVTKLLFAFNFNSIRHRAINSFKLTVALNRIFHIKLIARHYLVTIFFLYPYEFLKRFMSRNDYFEGGNLLNCQSLENCTKDPKEIPFYEPHGFLRLLAQFSTLYEGAGKRREI